MGPVEGMVVMEELGRGIVLEPFAQTLIASAVLGGYAPADVQAAWLPKIASGEALVVLAHTERKARYRLDMCEADATQASAGYALTASKSVVPAGDAADAFIVPAKIGDKIALFLVERTAAGVTTRGYGTQDGGRAAELTCANSPATLITTEGLTALEHAVDVGIAALCAEAVGVMDKTLDVTVEYMNTSASSSACAIATFQALRHRVADMKMQLELARSMSYYASASSSMRRPTNAAARWPAPNTSSASRCVLSASRRCSCTAVSA